MNAQPAMPQRRYELDWRRVPAISSNEPLQASIEHLRWLSLGAAILLAPCGLVLWAALGEPEFGTWARALGIRPCCLGAWCWLLDILGFGMKPNPRGAQDARPVLAGQGA